MDYEVIMTIDAENDLNQFLEYLMYEKQSVQAAKNLLDDFEQTLQNLQIAAGSLKDCENPKLRERGADCHPKRPPVPYYPASVSHIIRPAINHYSTVLLT